MSVEANLARAIELDDNEPDDVCPGCGWRIRITRQSIHWLPGSSTVKCPWDYSFLLARQFRRDYIKAHWRQVS